MFLVDDELRDLREKTEEDLTDLSICNLCTSRRSGKCDDVFFKLDDKYNEMVLKIHKIKDSHFFKKMQEKYGRKFRDNVVTMELLFTIWSNICQKLESKNQKFVDGEMQLKKISNYVKMFSMDYKALEEEFMLLSSFFSGATRLDQLKKKLGLVINKVKSYKKLFNTQQAAQVILELQKALDLQGDFTEIKGIEEVRLYSLYSL